MPLFSTMASVEEERKSKKQFDSMESEVLKRQINKRSSTEARHKKKFAVYEAAPVPYYTPLILAYLHKAGPIHGWPLTGYI